jgi:hypothetical protein
MRFGSLDFAADGNCTLRWLAGKEAVAPAVTDSLFPPGAFPCARYIAMADTCPEDATFTSCSEDEGEQLERHCCMTQTGANPSANEGGGADHMLDNVRPPGFPNLVNETGPVIFTQGIWRSISASNSIALDPLNVQWQELGWLIRQHDAKLEQMHIVSAEHRQHLTEAEEARRAAPTAAHARTWEVRAGIMQTDGELPIFPRISQNVIAASLLLCDVPEPEDSEGCQKVARLKMLLERADIQ